jgi:ribonuclease BN (tRNA processing enzyme)
MFDCGNGALANLYRVADPYSIDAVFITHNHPDHYVDLYSMQAMLRYAPEGPMPSVPLYMPEPLFTTMQALLSKRVAAEFREAFAFAPLVDGVPVLVGGITVTPREVDHTEPTFALVASDGVSTLCYTADTAPGVKVLAAARGCGLLLAEATLPEEYAGAAPHLTAVQAASLARDAGARTLVLTHVWPTNDREAMAREAATVFDGQISIAEEFSAYDVP